MEVTAMVNSTRNWNTDPRYRSSGKLGSEEWANECDLASGGFMENPGMSWKTVLLSVLAIVAIGLLVLWIAEPFMTVN